MNATISMDALYDFLKSLSLGSENERWLAERLLNRFMKSTAFLLSSLSPQELTRKWRKKMPAGLNILSAMRAFHG